MPVSLREWVVNINETKMHSSRMRTARSLIVSPYLVISHVCPPPQEQPRMPPSPRSNHAPPPREQPRMPPGATMHPPQEQPCMPPPEQPHTPPPQSNHARSPEQPRTPPLSQTSFAGGNNGCDRGNWCSSRWPDLGDIEWHWPWALFRRPTTQGISPRLEYGHPASVKFIIENSMLLQTSDQP